MGCMRRTVRVAPLLIIRLSSELGQKQTPNDVRSDGSVFRERTPKQPILPASIAKDDRGKPAGAIFRRIEPQCGSVPQGRAGRVKHANTPAPRGARVQGAAA